MSKRTFSGAVGPYIIVLFSSPVQKYRNSYCSHHGVGVSVAQMLKFLVKVFKSISFEVVDGSS